MTSNTATAATKTATAPTPAAAKGPKAYRAMCPECGSTDYTGSTSRMKIFCCEAHRVTFTNRNAARGKTLLPIALGWRNARGGAGLGSKAFAEMTRLLDHFAAEDAAAGRPNMMNYTDHLMNHSIGHRWNDGRRGTRTGRR